MKDKLKEAVRVYDKIASIYSKYNYEKLMQFQLTRFESLLKGKRILDVGCGVGRDVEYLMHDGYDVTGVDISENMIKEAKKVIKKGKFEVMDFRKMKFKAKSFDGIWAMASLYHIDRKDVEKSLKEFFRVLDVNGILYLAVYEGEGEVEVKKTEYGENKRTIYLYKDEEIRKSLEKVGFEIISCEVNTTENHKWLEVYAEKKG
jgi:ubiquinone/menaquinone biosynthesis C-methylase UbiE